MKKSLTKIVLVNFLVFFVAILVVEIFFGHWFASHNFGPYMREHRLKKNPSVLLYDNSKYSYVYKRNYHGFRGDEIDPSQIEAVIIGGSTTDERYKPYELTITSNLNSLLKKNGYNFKITNAGIEGQSTFGHIYNFKHWFPKLKNFSPKLYIFYIGINDYSFKPEQNNKKNKSLGDGHVKNSEALEVFGDIFKSSSFFYDKMRMLKQKYYLTSKTHVYDHDAYLKTIKNFKYRNYKELLELYDVEKLKVKHKIIISNYLDRVKTLNDYVKKENSTAVFINQVLPNGNDLEKFFILNHSLIEYCKDVNMNCIDLASKLNGKFNYWYDTVHTTGLGSKVIAEIVIDDLVKIIKKKKIVLTSNRDREYEFHEAGGCEGAFCCQAPL